MILRCSIAAGFVAALAFVQAALGGGKVELKTESWANSDAEFAKFARQIEDGHGRNVLARRGVMVYADGVDARELTDGSAGARGGDGRVNINGHPSVIRYYLGQLKSIHRVGLFTFNIDARANQDYEVRLADNSVNPGKMPKFPDEPTFSSGEKIIGPNGGGFHSHFAVADGGPIAPARADWVEFRIWATYGGKAGDPAKKNDLLGWSAAIELEVWSDEQDAIVVPPEELARRKAVREMGKRPPYEKQADWWQTMVAYREGLLKWECELDRMMLPDSGVTIGPWHAVGPLPADSEAARLIERLRQVNLAQPITIKGKQPRTLTWQPRPDLKDGQLLDLAKTFDARGGQVIYLCRPIRIDVQYSGRDGFVFGLGLGSGSMRVVGGQSRLSANADEPRLVPNQYSWFLREGPGSYHVLAALPVTGEGRCELWCMPQPPLANPGAGKADQRLGRRRDAFGALEKDFADPVSRAQMAWERADSIWLRFEPRAMAGREYFMSDWAPGDPSPLADQYNRFAAVRAEAVAKELRTLEPAVRAKAAPCLERLLAAAPPADLAAARKHYYQVAALQTALAEHHRIESMRLAVVDQRETFGDRYPKAGEYLGRIEALEGRMARAWEALGAGGEGALPAVLGVRDAIDAEGQAILLANPLLAFDKLLLGRGGPGFGSNWGGPNHIGSALVALSPVRPDGKLTAIHEGGHITDMDLSFDARKVLFSDGGHIHEVNIDGTGHRQITRQTDQHVQHYDACRLPNGKIMFVSTACEQAVPCTGQWYVGNMHLMDDDGSHERRLTFDQDHNWNPGVLNNGQVIYTRWEYTDTPHYFTRLLFTMNPDGTAQMEYYGSNSYWPNAMYWPRAIPGHPTRIVCIVSGHHGVSRVGQMVILDTAKGRQEADGVVQRIGERGKVVEPVILDGLVKDWWPRFAMPCPLAEPGTYRGAGKYFLVNGKMDEYSPWGVYLVDVFDNMTPLLMGSYAMPTPVVARPTPPVIPPRVDLARNDALVYMADVYRGGGLAGFPVGSVKALRIGSHVYRFGGNGDTRASSYEGGWDVKRILGTVPVEPDGSAYFRVPANTPIFVQPLNAEGQALQVMRSWFTAMPGEVISCVGCHEKQSLTPPVSQPMAVSRPPSEIRPWFGPTRGFSFDREVQPVLDRRCAGCHDGQPRKDGRQIPDFRAKCLHKDYKGDYSPAYLALAAYVRRAGYEADYHLPAPAEFNADTSPLIQMLKKGHHNVQLTPEELRRVYAWIDFNVPYPANWRESHRPPEDEQVQRRAKYMKLYAHVADRDESPLTAVPVAKFEPPAPEGPAPQPLKLDGWPLKPGQAADLQRKTGLGELVLDLGEGVKMSLVPIPAGRFVMGDAAGAPDERHQAVVSIDEPFHLGRLEVTNRQYACFEATHDSAYIDARGKDRFTRGYPANEPDQPVIRVTWYQAMAFARWLSRRTGFACTLPTEAEWEYACRAGTDTAWSFGDSIAGLRDLANIADNSLQGWAFGRVDRDYSDGARFSVAGGRYPPNAWGLCDLHGNVAEWTLSDYRPYPCAADDGRNAPPDPTSSTPAAKIVRGGSWNDKSPCCRSASRWRYAPHQPVYNVGFRVLCRPAKVAKR